MAALPIVRLGLARRSANAKRDTIKQKTAARLASPAVSFYRELLTATLSASRRPSLCHFGGTRSKFGLQTRRASHLREQRNDGNAGHRVLPDTTPVVHCRHPSCAARCRIRSMVPETALH